MSVFLAIVFIAALGYYLSLKVHPQVKCKRCDGSNRHYDLVYSGRRTLCPACGGSGRRPRLGTRLFRGGSSR
jgi:DnaJ-class molecular chaperone